MNPDNVLSYERVPHFRPVARFGDAGEARLAAAKLESEELDCDVVEHTPAHGLGARGATLRVDAEQFQRAVQVLSTTPARRCLLVNAVLRADQERSVPPPTLRARLLHWWTGRR